MRTILEPPTYPVAFQVAHLYLEQRQVAQDLNIVLVPLERIPVALDRLVILFICALQDAVDMPTDVTLQIVAQAALHVLVRLLLAPQTVECQPLHRQRLTVLGKLWICQDLFGQLQPVLVLLHFVAFLQRKTVKSG